MSIINIPTNLLASFYPFFNIDYSSILCLVNKEFYHSSKLKNAWNIKWLVKLSIYHNIKTELVKLLFINPYCTNIDISLNNIEEDNSECAITEKDLNSLQEIY